MYSMYIYIYIYYVHIYIYIIHILLVDSPLGLIYRSSFLAHHLLFASREDDAEDGHHRGFAAGRGALQDLPGLLAAEGDPLVPQPPRGGTGGRNFFFLHPRLCGGHTIWRCVCVCVFLYLCVFFFLRGNHSFLWVFFFLPREATRLYQMCSLTYCEAD